MSQNVSMMYVQGVHLFIAIIVLLIVFNNAIKMAGGYIIKINPFEWKCRLIALAFLWATYIVIWQK